MTVEFFLEICSEEIPSRMQKQALATAKDAMLRCLNHYQISLCEEINVWVSPSRLAIATIIPKLIQFPEVVKRGPNISCSEEALEGFLKSVGKESSEALYQEKGYWIFKEVPPSCSTKDTVPSVVELFLKEMKWPKSMRWHNFVTQEKTASWVRPIRSVLCLYNGIPLAFSLAAFGLITSRTVTGHRFLSPEPVSVFSALDYRRHLRDKCIYVDWESRRQKLLQLLQELEEKEKICIIKSEDLVDEVVGLVEMPFVAIGLIDPDFMKLPEKILITSMKVHQKYFAVRDQQGNLISKFVVVAQQHISEKIKKGFESVLKARLKDALFFFKNDVNNKLADLVPLLDRLIYHEKLGSVLQKVRRLENLLEDPMAKRAAYLCKADLLTQIVQEFPELQGHMGSYYALLEGEPQEVADALYEYYTPKGTEDNVPVQQISASLSFADKLDHLVGFLGAGLHPTGSKDPYALRRAALGLIRLLIDNKWQTLSLRKEIEKSRKAYFEQGFELSSTVVNDVLTFVQERFVFFMKGRGVPVDYIKSISDSPDLNPWDMLRRLDAFQAVLTKGDDSLQKLWRRVAGFLKHISDKGNGPSVNFRPVLTDIERNLDILIKAFEARALSLFEKAEYTQYLTLLKEISPVALSFFDDVTILSTDPQERADRLALVHRLAVCFQRLADWSYFV